MLVRTIAVATLSTCALASDITVLPGSSIQAAIDGASNGDRILIQPGTYNEAIDLRGKLLIIEGVMGSSLTVLDGTGFNDSVVSAVTGEPLGTLLRGLTIRGGRGRNLPPPSTNVYGGGVLVTGNATHLEVDDCVIRDNGGPTTTFGGGLYCGFGARMHLVGCVVRDNEVSHVGGAGYSDWYGAELLMERCTVISNRSPYRGGLGFHDATITVNTCIVWSNDGPEVFEYSPPNPGAAATVLYSDMDGGWSGVGNINVDPGFLSPTDLALSPWSPCIDVGDPALPLDADGTRADMGAHAYNPNTPTTSFCFGDGTSAACPCAPSAAGYGCPNSVSAIGARLASTGYAGVTYDTFKLTSTGVPNGPGLYFQGTGATDLPFFGDGKFCAGIGVVRMGVTFASSNSSSYPDAVATIPIHVAGGVPAAGGTRYYQLWYRDNEPTFCTPSLFNLTNGLSVVWVP